MIKQAPVRILEHKRRGRLIPFARTLKQHGAKVLLREVDDVSVQQHEPVEQPKPAPQAEATHASHVASDPLENFLSDLKDLNLISPECEIDGDEEAEAALYEEIRATRKSKSSKDEDNNEPALKL
ncbi:MAG: hypothetical protein KDD66_04970 [Bdellovibrionales bacterium]|nr:hypothetical protein [Bdellovibrionales bacterium]